MGQLIVQKYGGSSVADPEKIKNVARRVAESAAPDHRMVVVVSAMGKTTDGLLALASAITSNPDPREMDMLLATGEQSEEHTPELQSQFHLVCRLLLEKKNTPHSLPSAIRGFLHLCLRIGQYKFR